MVDDDVVTPNSAAAGQAAESDEEDDGDDEPPPGFYRAADAPSSKTRTSVSAEAYGAWNQKKAFVPPKVPKSAEQRDRLKSCLRTSYLFSTLEEKDLTIVIDAMSEHRVSAQQKVINQGDDGDFLFVVEKGRLQCLIRGRDGVEKVVKTCEACDVFGELALLYNCPRAASVVSLEASVLWKIDRDTFGNIVQEAAQKKRDLYEEFLANVPLLKSMDKYERSQVADALKTEVFAAGTCIVQAGDVGTTFYIVAEGQAVAAKDGKEVMRYRPGDYFGELALIRNQPRAATVTASTFVKALTVDRRSFHRLLHVNDLLERTSQYK